MRFLREMTGEEVDMALDAYAEVADGWRCPYCGKQVPDGCPDPAVFLCCGEIGHAEKNDELAAMVDGDRTGTGANK